MPFEKRVGLAKKILLSYFKEILDSYSFEEASADEIRRAVPYSKKKYSGICDNESKKILINKCKKGYGQMRTLLHECLEAIIGDSECINVNVRHNGKTYIFPHSRIDDIVENMINLLKSQ